MLFCESVVHSILLMVAFHSMDVLQVEVYLGCFQFLKQLWIFTYRFSCEHVFFSFGSIPGSGIAGSCGRYVFTFIRNGQTCSKSGCTILHFHHFSFPPAVCESSSSTSSPSLDIARFSHFRYSNSHTVVSYCGFNLYFPYN